MQHAFVAYLRVNDPPPFKRHTQAMSTLLRFIAHMGYLVHETQWREINAGCVALLNNGHCEPELLAAMLSAFTARGVLNDFNALVIIRLMREKIERDEALRNQLASDGFALVLEQVGDG